MSDREKIGVRVDASLWNEFRDDVQARKGQVRGVLSDELETAIREYLYGVTDTEKSIEEKLARLESHVDTRLAALEDEVGVVTADGGAETFDAEPHTHAPTDPTVEDKPAANAATDKKIAYLAGCVLERESTTREQLQSISRAALIDVVKAEYGFRADTAKRYVERLVEHFDMTTHPKTDDVFVTESKREELLDSDREEAKAEADDRLSEVTDA